MPPTKRKPGRPKGSRNKPKSSGTASTPYRPEASPTVVLPVVETVSVDHGGVDGAPDGPASLLAYHHARLKDIGRDLARARANKDSLTKDIAPLIAAESTCLKAIADLTGATKLTLAKVLGSDVWRELTLRIAHALAPFPEARKAMIEAVTNGSDSGSSTQAGDG